jgi:hypothetical protein
MRGWLWPALLTGTLVFKVSGQSNLPPVIPVTEATNYLYQQVVVRDVVVQVALRSTVALLNLNQQYPGSPLTCVIQANHTNRFPDLDGYLGQLVEVSGRVTAYQGRPQIILTSTNQIKVLDAAPAGSQPLLATSEAISPAAAADPPAITPQVAAPTTVSAEAKPEHAVWWVLGVLGGIVGLLGASVLWLWRRGTGSSGGSAPSLAVARLTAPLDATTDSQTAEEWKQRALVAEAMAGQHGQKLREKLMPELLDFAKQSLVQGLYAQRSALLETQQVAQKTLEELEGRLAALQLPSPERIRAYEQRIAELEKEVAAQGENVRELTRATLDLLRRKLESEREGSVSLDWRGRPH